MLQSIEPVDDRELPISFGESASASNWSVEFLTWGEFVDRLRTARRTSETMVQYDKLSKARKAALKDGPAFVGGLVRGGRRRKENVDVRSVITLDADNVSTSFPFMVELMIGGTAYVIYSTHSHRSDQHKYRLIILVDREMTPDECSAVSRMIAKLIGMDNFDKTTFDVNRLMYLPSCSKDAEPVFIESEGVPLSVDGILNHYQADWRDPASWPRHPKEAATLFTGQKPQDPREKRGIVGLFCRAFPIETAIDMFLSDVYTAGSMAGRYTYAGGTSANGLEIYSDQELVFSHQDSDPAADGHSHNAFDLVRIHRYGHMDENAPLGTSIDELPSHQEMTVFAASLEDVRLLQQAESSAEIAEAFGDMDFPGNDGGEHALDLSQIIIPLGFKVIGGQVFEVKETKTDIKHIQVCSCLVAVTGRYSNLSDHTQGLEVSWVGRSGIKSVTDTRSTFADSKKLINLADYGLPVHSENARKLSAYLSRFEAENEERLSTKLVSNQLGWVKDGFLLGEQFIGSSNIEFLPKDAGDGQTARGFRKRGSMEGTMQLLDQIKPFPAVKLAVYAAATAPLLSLWGESSFILELAGSTSRGKTTALRIAASLYGCPDENKPGIFRQWNMTKVAIERYAATMNHLPLFLDDTKKTDERTARPIVYQFSSGQGKGRGSLKGAQASAGWQTVMLSTGEQKLSSFAKDGGAVGRVLSLEGSPFLSADLTSAKMVQEMNKLASDHYGHLAEPWIRFLMTTDMSVWKGYFSAACDRYMQIGSGAGEVALRLSRIMALLDVTGQMFDTCFNLKLYDRAMLDQEWSRLISESPELDRATEALDSVMGWVTANTRQFIINGSGSPLSGKLYGEIKPSEIFAIDDLLDEHLRSRGYEPLSIAKAWKDRGWTKATPGRTKFRKRMAGGNPWTYCFDLTALGWAFDTTDRYSPAFGG
ncbi:DUF927 domain-containing protein [Paenibacillus herberti]|uniref:DUF927 domain-containing protein n=1 Tax=Paenibacillus herberti TaxID=1619309 RepID=A0A229P0K7_9BACL|nr:DUF927 domain-containing protein [Paenibacillus herberti]OXM15445.1 hypothetical protein CGZ75_01510 [Paenibacillus herberti]